jgi:hypothetical protein
MSKHIFAKSKRCKASVLLVDTAGIEGKKMQLPGEVSVATRWYNREVSRGHSTCGKRDVHSHIGLTNREGLNVVLLEIKMGA